MMDERTQGSLKGMTVLIVDDNTHMRRLIGTLLQVIGSPTCLEASCGKQAADILTRVPIDLLICDWRMGEMSGLELVKVARCEGYLRNPLLPIVAVSAYSNDHMVREMYAAGANAVMTKPIGISTFVSTISRVTQRPNAFRQAGKWFGPEHGGGAEVHDLS
ncbi:MAG: response regulator [Rhodospirillaceae bacterium]